SGADPFAVHGTGWAFTAKTFPGSRVFRANANNGSTAPRATSVCESAPLAADCTSCGYASSCEAGTVTPDVPCAASANGRNWKASGDPNYSGEGFNGYYGVDADDLNVRFHHMKARYGVDPQYPIQRYVHGLLSARVPSYLDDHDANGTYVSN